MSSPYSQSYQVFASGTNATANATFSPGNIGAGDIKFGGSVAFQYVGAAFSGTFDFQGRPHSSASWVNLPYVVMGAAPTVSVAQVSQTTDSSTITYVVLMPMEEMRVVMTRSAGTFGMWAHSFEHVLGSITAIILGAGTANIGVVDTELPAAAAASDTIANPTTTNAMSMLMGYTPGGVWARARTTSDASGVGGYSPVLQASPLTSTEVGDSETAVTMYKGNGFNAIPGVAIMGYSGTAMQRLRTRGTGILQVESAFSFLNIAAGQATTTVKSGAGTLHTIVLNSAAVATNTTTIYDNTAASGTVIGRPAVTTATVPTTLTYDLAFGTGLTIITAVANGGDMTVTYR